MKLFDEITRLDTEQSNPASRNIDLVSSQEVMKIINEEDKRVPAAVEKEIPQIAAASDLAAEAFSRGGRLFYFGAGTSGRLGIVDASECPPTFGVSPELVHGIIAGGDGAVFKAREGSEDHEENAFPYFDEFGINTLDVVCGIAASGRTPFVIGALKKAKSLGISTIMITTIRRENAAHLAPLSDILICPYAGPEVISGSTRMKSGTAQKLVLNMITTGAMIKNGKTFGNTMVDLQLTNLKLRERAKNIVMQIAGVDYNKAENLLQQAGGNVKTALVMSIFDCSKSEAEEKITSAGGKIRKIEK